MTQPATHIANVALATVISADMDLIGQLQPHQPTRFAKVDMDTAPKARAERKAGSHQGKPFLNAA